jgi:hypothetical protein
MHLFHESGLAVAVGVNLGIELVHERRLVLTCSALVLAASGVVEIVAVNLAVVVAVNTATDNTTLSGRTSQVALASHATVGVGGVGVAAGQVLNTNLAVVVAVEGVAGTGGAVVGVGVAAGQVLGADLAVVVAVKGVASTDRAVVVEVTVAGVLVAVAGSLVSETSGSSDTTSTTDVLGDTLELVVALLAASEGTTLGLELLHGHGWESSSLMVGSLVMVNLMDGDGGVDNVGLDGLLLDNGLDGLVDVVMNVLSANSGGNALAVGGVFDATLVSKASLVVNQSPLGAINVAVVELAVLNSSELSSVLLGQNLAVLDGLDSAVVVVLVDFLVNGSVDLLVDVRLNDLVLDSGSNCLVDSGVMVTRAAHEVGDSCLRLVHCDGCVVVV